MAAVLSIQLERSISTAPAVSSTGLWSTPSAGTTYCGDDADEARLRGAPRRRGRVALRVYGRGKDNMQRRALRVAVDGSTTHRGVAELIPFLGYVVMVEG